MTGGTCPDRPLPLPQVSGQHWEFGRETTGDDGASGTSLSLPLLPSDPTATPQEMRYTTEKCRWGIALPISLCFTALIGEFVKAFLSENGNYVKL